jgi:toxin ParE1/3/4
VGRLIWSPRARRDLRNIRRYIGSTSRQRAVLFVQHLIARAELLTLFPHAGRIVPEDERGELREVIVRGYRIVYHVNGDNVEIDMVVHGAQQLTDLPEL